MESMRSRATRPTDGDEREVLMRCDFEKLWLYLGKKLDLDGQLEVLAHLDECEACFEAVYLMSRDRDAKLFVRYKLEDKLASSDTRV